MTIDEKAKVPLFAALAAIPTIFGFVAWLTAQHVKAESLQENVAKLENRQDQQLLMLTQIRDDVLIIKEQLKQKSAKGE